MQVLCSQYIFPCSDRVTELMMEIAKYVYDCSNIKYGGPLVVMMGVGCIM